MEPSISNRNINITDLVGDLMISSLNPDGANAQMGLGSPLICDENKEPIL